MKMRTRSKVEFVANSKWKKWQEQGGCGNPECPMKDGLNRKPEDIWKNCRKCGTGTAAVTPEDLFMSFCAQFEHRNRDEKEENMSALGTAVTDWDEEKIKEEANKCTVDCNFCARLKSVKHGDCRSNETTALEEAALLLDMDEVEVDDDDSETAILFDLLWQSGN